MKGNILDMSADRQWLDLGLDAIAPDRAARVRLFRLLLVGAAALRGRLDRELAPSGLTSQQGAMLQWIEAQPEPPTISAVAAGLRMTHQNVKQIALALERKGFVEIVVDPSDRRARRVLLTKQHRRFWRKRNPEDFANVAAWTAALSDSEVAKMTEMLSRLYRHLNEAP
jgi:DNA-binding MarR family transcriptional regulator